MENRTARLNQRCGSITLLLGPLRALRTQFSATATFGVFDWFDVTNFDFSHFFLCHFIVLSYLGLFVVVLSVAPNGN